MSIVVVDSSALLAILQGEEDAEALAARILEARTRVVGAPTLVEAAAVITARRGAAAGIALDALLQALEIEVVAMSPEAATYAREGWTKFGRVPGKPAVLNYGDCLAYGVAKAIGASLVYKGKDFGKTDLE